MISIGYGANTPEEFQTFIDLAERNSLIMRPEKYFAFVLRNYDEIHATLQSLKNVLSREM